MAENFDVVVIGSGPGGYVAAIRASQLGQKVALVEKEKLGGICLNWGCIPTKALLRSAEINHLLNNLQDFSVSNIQYDFVKVIKRSRAVSEKLSHGISHLLKKNKIEVINGLASLMPGKKVKITGKNTKEIIAKNIIIATGARARILEGMEPDGDLIWSYKEAMTPKKMPKEILVVGSGAIGVEFASFYSNMGCKVTVAEVADRILQAEDEEISQFARQSFEKQGIKIITNAKIYNLKKVKNQVIADIENNHEKTKLTVDNVIMAVGVIGNIENIGLENTKITIKNNSIVTNEFMETSESGIYAIGDVAGAPWLAHKASHEAIIAAESVAGKNPHPIQKNNIPGCTYCRPQIASVGLTEQQAKLQGYKIKVGRFPFSGNGKALALGEPEGLVKTIFDEKTGELLGAHMIGSEVTEMIQGYVIGKTMEATEEDFMRTIFPHPTLSEMMHESVLDAYNKVIHK